jgi:hypothetical protein
LQIETYVLLLLLPKPLLMAAILCRCRQLLLPLLLLPPGVHC